VREDPNDAVVRLALADSYFAAERYTEAATQYEAVFTIDDKSALALAGLGRSLYSAGDRDGAAAAFQKVVDAAQEADIRGTLAGAAYFYLGVIKLELLKPDEAIPLLRNAVLIDGADADAVQMLGAAYVATGNYDEALVYLAKAVRFVPNFVEAYDQMAIAYDGKGQPNEAKYARAMSLFSRERYSDAAKDLEAVTAALPRFTAAFVGLGQAREKLGQKEAAAAAYNMALSLDPNDFNARGGLVRLGALRSAPEDANHGVPAGTGGGR
jgi:tetratricopeptide (TPR) repeat protein